MKRLPKILSLVILLAMALSACQPAAQPAPAQGSNQSSTQKEYLVAYSQAELVNAWRVTNQKDMENQAKSLGVKLVSVDANQDPSKQLSDVENMLAQKPDCLIVSPLESKASAPVVRMAEEAKVPLVIIDRTIEATPGRVCTRLKSPRATCSRASCWPRRPSSCSPKSTAKRTAVWSTSRAWPAHHRSSTPTRAGMKS